MYSVPFTLLRARPDEFRGESMNVGVIVFHESGPRVFFDAPAWRLKALHPDLEHIECLSWATELESVLPRFADLTTQVNWLRGGLGSIYSDGSVGTLVAETEEDLSLVIEEVLERFVQPPIRTAPLSKQLNLLPRSGLHIQLRTWFRSAKLFSSKFEDLSKKRIVASYPVDPEDDLYADFAFKNGAIHIIEALDLRGVEKMTKSVRGQAGLAAVLLDQAKRTMPEGRRIAVTAADNRDVVRPVMSLVSKYADDVIVMESTEDRQRLADFVGEALDVPDALTLVKSPGTKRA